MTHGRAIVAIFYGLFLLWLAVEQVHRWLDRQERKNRRRS